MKDASVDLSRGVESCPIGILFKEDTLQGPLGFKYTRSSFLNQGATIELPAKFKRGEFCGSCRGKGCGGGRKRCPCSNFLRGLPPYGSDGLLHPHYIEMVVTLYLYHFFFALFFS